MVNAASVAVRLLLGLDQDVYIQDHRWDGSMVFVPTSHSDGREFEPSIRSQPARLGEKVEQQDYAGP